MQKYFETLEEISKGDKNDYGGILGLTREIAKRAGYEKKDGERPKYNKEFDSVLVAKWLCFFKKSFFSKLNRLPYMGDSRVDIVDSTFLSIFNSLDLDELHTDASVCTLFHKTLYSRTIDNTRGKSPQRNGFSTDKNCPVFASPSTFRGDDDAEDKSIEDIAIDSTESDVDMLLDIFNIVGDSRYGKEIVLGMLTSNKKIGICNIDKYINIPKEEQTKETKIELSRIWNKILNYIDSIGYRGLRTKKVTPSKFRYSWESYK